MVLDSTLGTGGIDSDSAVDCLTLRNQILKDRSHFSGQPDFIFLKVLYSDVGKVFKMMVKFKGGQVIFGVG